MKENKEMDFEVSGLIVRFLAGELSGEERLKLNSWITASTHNKVLFKRMCSVELKKEKLEQYANNESEEAFRLFLRERKRRECGHGKRRIIRFFGYAAMLVLLLSIAGVLYFSDWMAVITPKKEMVLTSSRLNIPTLILSDGQEILLDDGLHQLREVNGAEIFRSGNGELIYPERLQTQKALLYHTLKTPPQCDYHFTLSDGTKVWLNAASELKYPVIFDEKERVVYASGEIYFEVAKDAGSPFSVVLDNMKIQVSGTSFNVNSYPGENDTDITLVTGNVAVYTEKKHFHLFPSDQLHYDRNNETTRVQQVTVEDFISWKEGRYVFRGETLGKVIKVLQRWYDIRVVFPDPEYANTIYTGVIYKEEKIEDFVGRLKEASGLECRIEGDIIYMK